MPNVISYGLVIIRAEEKHLCGPLPLAWALGTNHRMARLRPEWEENFNQSGQYYNAGPSPDTRWHSATVTPSFVNRWRFDRKLGEESTRPLRLKNSISGATAPEIWAVNYGPGGGRSAAAQNGLRVCSEGLQLWPTPYQSVDTVYWKLLQKC